MPKGHTLKGLQKLVKTFSFWPPARELTEVPAETSRIQENLRFFLKTGLWKKVLTTLKPRKRLGQHCYVTHIQ